MTVRRDSNLARGGERRGEEKVRRE